MLCDKCLSRVVFATNDFEMQVRLLLAGSQKVMGSM